METVMKKMMLQQLLLKQKRDASIREQANLIANKLILEFEVNEGTKLAYFLTVPQGLDNFMALRVWVERELVRLDGFSSQSDLSQLHDILYDEVRNTLNTEVQREKTMRQIPETEMMAQALTFDS